LIIKVLVEGGTTLFLWRNNNVFLWWNNNIFMVETMREISVANNTANFGFFFGFTSIFELGL